jgi:hypothetical protein
LFDLVGFAAEIRAIDHDLEALGPHIVEKACKIIQKKAKVAIGKEHELWAPLAASTIADKATHGFKTPAPLLRTGVVRSLAIPGGLHHHYGPSLSFRYTQALQIRAPAKGTFRCKACYWPVLEWDGDYSFVSWRRMHLK